MAADGVAAGWRVRELLSTGGARVWLYRFLCAPACNRCACCCEAQSLSACAACGRIARVQYLEVVLDKEPFKFFCGAVPCPGCGDKKHLVPPQFLRQVRGLREAL